MSKQIETCSKSVSDHTGYHFWPCKRPAKYVITFDDGRLPTYRCGIHAKRLPVFATRTPVTK